MTPGINKVQISCYERGVNLPEPETLKKIARALGLPPDFILREESEWEMGKHKEGFDPAILIQQMKEEFKTLPIERKKIIDNVRKILESNNEWWIHALMASTEGIVEAIRTKKPNRKEGI